MKRTTTENVLSVRVNKLLTEHHLPWQINRRVNLKYSTVWMDSIQWNGLLFRLELIQSEFHCAHNSFYHDNKRKFIQHNGRHKIRSRALIVYKRGFRCLLLMNMGRKLKHVPRNNNALYLHNANHFAEHFECCVSFGMFTFYQSKHTVCQHKQWTLRNRHKPRKRHIFFFYFTKMIE